MKIALVVFMACADVFFAGGDGASARSTTPARNAVFLQSTDSPDPAVVATQVRAALRAGGYPWYDADSDKLRALRSSKPDWTKSLLDPIERLGTGIKRALEAVGKFLSRLFPSRGSGLVGAGDAFMASLLWIALAGLLLVLARLWYRRQQFASGSVPDPGGRGRVTLLAELAGTDGQANVDPWSEAVSRRASGDHAGALVYLFIHQLLSLDQIGMIRLAPGVTGRQYVSGLADADLRRSLGATLGLFEAVHYGHRRPSPAAFEMAWNQALAFRRDVLGRFDGR